MARFPTDVAASPQPCALSCAVDHVPDALLYKSTASEYPLPPAMTPVRRQPPPPHTQQTTSPTPQPRKHYTIAHTHQPNQLPFDKQREAAITYSTPREDGHVPNRCRSKTKARHTELRSRPCARCTVVQIRGIESIIHTTCSDPRQTATSSTAYTTNTTSPNASNTQTLHHRPHASTQTAAPQQTA
jgi:hypothetical protein